jgi:hypothetical protein
MGWSALFAIQSELTNKISLKMIFLYRLKDGPFEKFRGIRVEVGITRNKYGRLITLITVY